mmetsp:Transcript_43232/g.117012  ORF Transcript_43232/g.117012 Transcript_43232/m.117012 type:complete len:153 (-) Transcript_43232:480-938(-)
MGSKKRRGMDGMLSELRIELVGHHHLGIDDSRNIAKIALALAARGGVESIAATSHASDVTMYRKGNGLVSAREQAAEAVDDDISSPAWPSQSSSSSPSPSSSPSLITIGNLQRDKKPTGAFDLRCDRQNIHLGNPFKMIAHAHITSAPLPHH